MLHDEAIKVFINTKGTVGEVSEDFKKLMTYFNSSELNEDNTTGLTADIHKALQDARENKDWGHDYMTLEMIKRECLEEGRKEGKKEGRKEGMVEAYHGIGWSLEKISEAVGVSVAEVKKVLEQKLSLIHI